jgi:hypothetical protein
MAVGIIDVPAEFDGLASGKLMGQPKKLQAVPDVLRGREVGIIYAIEGMRVVLGAFPITVPVTYQHPPHIAMQPKGRTLTEIR